MASQQKVMDQQLSRRALLAGLASLGAASASAALCAACVPVQPKAAPNPAREQPAVVETPGIEAAAPTRAGAAQVAFVKTRDRAQGVRRALELLDQGDVHNKRVLLKPNFNSADPPPGSTHPDVLLSLSGALWEGGARSITVADRSGMGDTRDVMERLGVFAMASELDVDTVVLDELERSAWEMVQPYESHWQQGFPFPICCLEADAIVQTCCLKTHRYGGHFTLSLKNSVGMAAKFRPGDDRNYMTELHGSRHQRRMIAEINAAYTPDLIILDGVDAFVTGGPASGKLVEANVILAGTDRIAIDAVGVALLRHFGTTPEVSQGAIFEQEQIARAVELGLGVTEPAQIALLAGDPESVAYAAQIQQLLV